jgi:hypothetical protein
MIDITPEAMRRELTRLATAYPFVRLNQAKMAELASLIQSQLGAVGGPSFFDPRYFPNESPAQNNRDTLQFFLVLEALMFTIWRHTPAGKVEAWDITIGGERYVGARGLAAALMRAIRQGRNMLDASVLANLSLAEVKDIYRDEAAGAVTLQMLPERQQTSNEVGKVLLEKYDGHAAHLFEAANGYLFRLDGMGLVQQLNTHFPFSFGDWPFMKLAFLLATAVETRYAFDLPTTEEYRQLTSIRDPENFVGMADYYIPFFYARVGIFDIDEGFRRVLTNRTEIQPNSTMERNFRANQLLAMEALANLTGDRALVGPIDYESWRTGYLRCRPCHPDATNEDVPCPYRARCSAFNEHPDLMEIAWPLVLTTSY